MTFIKNIYSGKITPCLNVEETRIYLEKKMKWDYDKDTFFNNKGEILIAEYIKIFATINHLRSVTNDRF
jgi:hypothetical protein